MAGCYPAVHEEEKVDVPPSSSCSDPLPPPPPAAVSLLRPSVLLESKKQNSLVSPALLAQHLKQGTPSQNAFFSPICKNPCSFSGNSTQFPAGRYKSPTDSLISPISRGLLAKGRKATKPSPAFVPPKVLDNTFDISNMQN